MRGSYLGFLTGVWEREDAGLDSGDTLTPLLFNSWDTREKPAVTQCRGWPGAQPLILLLTRRLNPISQANKPRVSLAPMPPHFCPRSVDNKVWPPHTEPTL